MYLAFILALSSLSVMLTILVLEVHFRSNEDREMSNVNRRICRFLMKITCWGNKPCSQKIQPIDGDIDQMNDMKEKKLLKIEIKPKPDVVSHDEIEEEDAPNWQLYSKVLDYFFFVSFLVIIATGTLSVVGILLDEYMNYSTTAAS